LLVADSECYSGTPSQLQRTRGLCDWIGIEAAATGDVLVFMDGDCGVRWSL
jgi:hypothetical protein